MRFEAKLSKNLYKLWNRMASGSYFPAAVKRVEIPKKKGGKRPLGIPTVYDRVGQEVVRQRLEQELEPKFHRDSYGYRAGKSAIEAVGVCRERNWRYNWVLDVDIQQFFDTIDHSLLLKAIRKHCSEKWMLLYIERWLKAPVQHKDGSLEQVTKGTPQGGVISPLLANLYLHYAFDMWICRQYPKVKFERYADDIIIHCHSKAQAVEVQASLARRMSECGLTLHPTKTRIVCCKVRKRSKDSSAVSYTFLGYTFKPRSAVRRCDQRRFTGFIPAASTAAKVHLRCALRAVWCPRRTSLSIRELARLLNPILRGWFNYFSHYGVTTLALLRYDLDRRIHLWIMKKFRIRVRRAIRWLRRWRETNVVWFAHWQPHSTSNR